MRAARAGGTLRRGVHTYFLEIAYDGGAYAGWQRQDGFDTVQQRLEDAVRILVGDNVDVHGSGRTDAGVHALRQGAHVRLERDFDPPVLLRALNGNLPRDIAVRVVRRALPEFHARFSAIGKRYLYRYVIDRVRPVFARGHSHWVRRPLDLAAMRRAASEVVGEQDFACFAANPGYERSRGTVRSVQHLHLIRRPWGLDLVIQGNGFLYNMVRAIAGTLQEVGTGRFTPERVRSMIDSRDRRQGGYTAPAAGLYLVRALYPPGLFESPGDGGAMTPRSG